MPNRTKYDLEASLKKLLLQKPLDKITISDLSDGFPTGMHIRVSAL